MTTHTASIRIDQEQLARLDRMAAALKRSRSWVINQSIERYLDYEEWFRDAVAEGARAADRGDLVSHDQAMKAARGRIAKGRKENRGVKDKR